MAEELPKLFTDEEFNEQRRLRERRELPDRRVEERRVAPQGRRRTDGRPESTIEQKFPHITNKLTTLWPSDGCALYLSALTVSDRPDRQGFPPEVMEDLMMLSEINDLLLGKPALERPTVSLSPWGEGGARRERDSH